MRLPRGLQIFRYFSERTRRSSWVPSDRGREGLQDRHLSPQKEAGRSFVSRNEDLRNIAPSVQIKDVVIAVSREAGIPTEALLGHGRQQPLARWRHLAFLLAHELTHQPLMQIGRAMNRDHSTVWNGCRRAKERMRDDAELRFSYDKLKINLRG